MQLNISTPADQLIRALDQISNKLSDWADYHRREALRPGCPRPIALMHYRLMEHYQELILTADSAVIDFEEAR